LDIEKLGYLYEQPVQEAHLLAAALQLKKVRSPFTAD
jgi:hypothetical protein